MAGGLRERKKAETRGPCPRRRSGWPSGTAPTT